MKQINYDKRAKQGCRGRKDEYRRVSKGRLVKKTHVWSKRGQKKTKKGHKNRC